MNLKDTKQNIKYQTPNHNKGITLVALIITIIVLIILASVSIGAIFGGEGILAKARESKILAAIASIKDELGLSQVKGVIAQNPITIESLFAEGKVRRKVEAETILTAEENYYIYYALKDEAFQGMGGLGKGVITDVFLIDDEFNVSYIDKDGKEYGDIIQKKLLEDNTQIRFVSPAFAAYISKLGGATEGEMLFKWMKTQTSLMLNDPNIENLDDLVFFPNLTNIQIIIPKLRSLVGIECCKKLTSITLNNTGTLITDFSPLVGLKNLKSFNFQNSALTNENFPNLIENLAQINTLTSFSGYAYFTVNSIEGIGKLKNLTYFSMAPRSSSELKGLKEISKLTKLETLGLSNINMEKIEGLNSLSKLTSLSLTNTKITKVEGLDNLKNLTTLNLSSNQITDIMGVSNLINLTSLQLQHNKITDITAIESLTNLKTLNLSSNQIVDVLPLAACNKLTSLNLKENATIRVGGYTDEENLKLLEIAKIMTERKGTISVDKEKLSLFNGYTTLDFSGQGLTDLTLLTGQTELTYLNLSGNQITLSDKESQEILKKMTKLQTLDLRSNNLTDISAINDLNQLTNIYLSGDNNNINLKQMENRISTSRLIINDAQFATIKNCTPSVITKIDVSQSSVSKLPDLSNFTNLTSINIRSTNITNITNITSVKGLKRLALSRHDMHEKITDLSALKNLNYLDLSDCSLWTTDLEKIRGLKNNKNLTLYLNDNHLIDPKVLLEFDTSDTIYLGGNVNISTEFKAKLTDRFGTKVKF